jgi:hypothetical protein
MPRLPRSVVGLTAGNKRNRLSRSSGREMKDLITDVILLCAAFTAGILVAAIPR